MQGERANLLFSRGRAPFARPNLPTPRPPIYRSEEVSPCSTPPTSHRDSHQQPSFPNHAYHRPPSHHSQQTHDDPRPSTYHRTKPKKIKNPPTQTPRLHPPLLAPH